MKLIGAEKRISNAVAKSYNAINTFTDVIKQLQEANAELASAREADIERIEQLRTNVERSATQELKNTEIIDKINRIIE